MKESSCQGGRNKEAVSKSPITPLRPSATSLGGLPRRGGKDIWNRRWGTASVTYLNATGCVLCPRPDTASPLFKRHVETPRRRAGHIRPRLVRRSRQRQRPFIVQSTSTSHLSHPHSIPPSLSPHARPVQTPWPYRKSKIHLAFKFVLSTFQNGYKT